jgi:exosome complex component RRP45
VALNAQHELCVVQKLGGVPLTPDDILKTIEVAVRKAKELSDVVEARLNEDWTGRTVEIR